MVRLVHPVVELLQEHGVLVAVLVVVDMLDRIQAESVHTHLHPFVGGLRHCLERPGLLCL